MEEKKEIRNEETDEILEKRKEVIKDKFLNWLKNPYDRILFIVLIATFIIRFWIFLKTMNQPLWYDEASFLATAKTWAFNLDVNNIWYYRRGFFWVLFSAFFFKIGLGELAIKFMVVLFSTGVVLISYLLISEMFNKKYALLVSIGTALSWVFLFFTGRPMTEIPATFFLLIAIFFFWKGYVLGKGNKFIYLSGVFYALAALTRMQYLMFALPVIVLIFTREKFRFIKNKHLWITILIFLMMLLPFFILYSMNYGFFIKDILAYYLGIGGGGTIASSASTKTFLDLFDYFKDLPYLLSSCNPPVVSTCIAKPIYAIYALFLIGSVYFLANLFFGIDKIFKNEIIRKNLFIFLFIITAFMTLGRITETVEQRYVMPVLPFLLLVSIIPLLKLEDFSAEHLKINRKFTAFLAIIILIALLIPGFLFANSLIESKKNSYLEVKESGLWIRENSNPGDVVLSRSIPQTLYYSERPTYTTGANESAFEQNIQEKNPRFLILSVFEIHQPWEYSYPQIHNDTLTPVKVYQQGEQPVLIIYEFNRSPETFKLNESK